MYRLIGRSTDWIHFRHHNDADAGAGVADFPRVQKILQARGSACGLCLRRNRNQRTNRRAETRSGDYCLHARPNDWHVDSKQRLVTEVLVGRTTKLVAFATVLVAVPSAAAAVVVVTFTVIVLLLVLFLLLLSDVFVFARSRDQLSALHVPGSGRSWSDVRLGFRTTGAWKLSIADSAPVRVSSNWTSLHASITVSSGNVALRCFSKFTCLDSENSIISIKDQILKKSNRDGNDWRGFDRSPEVSFIVNWSWGIQKDIYCSCVYRPDLFASGHEDHRVHPTWPADSHVLCDISSSNGSSGEKNPYQTNRGE